MLKNLKSMNWKTAWPVPVLFAWVILYYWQIFLAQGAWIVGDHAEQHFPWAFYLAQQLKQGSLPLWTDLIHTGFPITAEGQIGTFYLPNLLFYTLLPIREGYAWNIGFHLLLSALFMSGFLRSLGLRPAAVLFGTLTYLFGSTLGGAYYNITSLKVLTWFPLALGLSDGLLRQARGAWWRTLLLGLLFSLQLLAGYLQFAVYALLFTGLYAFFRFFDQKERRWQDFVRLFGCQALAVLLAALSAFPQLFVTWQLAIRSSRAGAAEAFAYVGSYSPFAAVCLLFPSMEGLFISKLYLGILPLFFITASIFFFRNFPYKSIYWLALLGFLLALGGYNPLYVGLLKLLNFYSFRTPIKFIFFAGFFLSILAAVGMHYVLAKDEDGRRTGRAWGAYAGFLAVVTGGVILAFGAFHWFDDQLYRLGEWMVRTYIYGKPGHPFPWEHYEVRLSEFILHAQTILDPRGKVIWLQVLKMAGAVILIRLFLKTRLRQWIFVAGALGLLALDLNFSYSDIRGDYANYPKVFEKPPVVQYLERNLGTGRYFVYSSNPSDSPLPASRNMLFGLETANAYSPLVVKDYYEFFGAMGGINDSIANHPVDDDFLRRHTRLLGMLNVKYIVSDRMLSFFPDLRLVFEDNGWRIYEMRQWMPWAFAVRQFEIYEDPEALNARLRDSLFDPARTALYEARPENFFGRQDPEIQEDYVELRTYQPEYKALRVDCAQTCTVVFNQIFYPGWQVNVDGQAARLYPVNGILSGLPLKAGRHQIELNYKPFESVRA